MVIYGLWLRILGIRHDVGYKFSDEKHDFGFADGGLRNSNRGLMMVVVSGFDSG